MLAGQIAEIVKTVHTRWLNLIEIMRWRTDGVSLQHIALRIGVVSTVYGVITSLLIVTGIIFLIFAFYLKFKQQSVEVPKPPVTSL